MSTIHSPFSSRLSTYNFSSVPIVFCQFFTWVALGGADLHFSHVLVRIANAVEEETTLAMWFYHQHNQSIQVMA